MATKSRQVADLPSPDPSWRTLPAASIWLAKLARTTRLARRIICLSRSELHQLTQPPIEQDQTGGLEP